MFSSHVSADQVGHLLDAVRAHRKEFSEWVTVHVAADRRSGDPHRASARLDVSDMPKFRMGKPRVAGLMTAAALDLGILSVMTLIFFGLAYRAFRSYDPR